MIATIKHTSSLQFLSASTEEPLNFFRSDFRSLPRVGPCGLCGTRVFDNGVLGRFLCSIGVFTPKDTSEKGHLSSTDVGSTAMVLC
jgi:hypothetical protein